MAAPAQGPLVDVPRAKVLSNELEIEILSLECEDRGARNHRKAAPAGQRCYDVFGKAVSKRFIVWADAIASKRQYCDGWPLAETLYQRCTDYRAGLSHFTGQRYLIDTDWSGD